MEHIKNVALSICILIAFMSLLSIITPQNKFSSIFKMFLNVLTLLFILKPFLMPFNSFSNFNNSEEFNTAIKNYSESSEIMMNNTIDIAIDRTLKIQIKNQLNKDNISVNNIENVFVYNDNNLFIEKVRVFIDSDIDENSVKNSIEKIIDTKVEVIFN